MSTKELIDEAVSLPVDERALVVDSLLRSLDRPEPGIDEEWVRIAEQRLDEMRRGEVQAVPGEEVFRRIRERLAR